MKERNQDCYLFHRGAARAKIDRFLKNKLRLEIFFIIVAAFYSNFFSQTALNKNHRKLPDLQILSKVAKCLKGWIGYNHNSKKHFL